MHHRRQWQRQRQGATLGVTGSPQPQPQPFRAYGNARWLWPGLWQGGRAHLTDASRTMRSRVGPTHWAVTETDWPSCTPCASGHAKQATSGRSRL